jgi:hypothetical protein
VTGGRGSVLPRLNAVKYDLCFIGEAKGVTVAYRQFHLNYPRCLGLRATAVDGPSGRCLSYDAAQS